jgi:hypothetical protein
MSSDDIDKGPLEPDGRKRAVRAAMNALSGAVPGLGGLLSAGASYWSEREQEQVTNVLRQWLQMLEDELREKGRTIAEIVARLDMHEEEVRERVESPEYQALLKKAFRNWSAIDTEFKRQRVRNIPPTRTGLTQRLYEIYETMMQTGAIRAPAMDRTAEKIRQLVRLL